MTFEPSGDGAGRRIGELHWQRASGETITWDRVTRDLGGRVVGQTVDGVDPNGPVDNFTYDAAGRLSSAALNATDTATYGFAASGGCGTSGGAGRNTNRTTLSVNATVTATYCYDMADRLSSTTAAGVGAVAYDAHGNTTTISGETHGYDGADRHISTVAGGTSVRYGRDALGRIVARYANDTLVARYGYSLAGDSADHALDATNVVIERTWVLPGGVLLTRRAGTEVWSCPNIDGDLVAQADAAGVKVGATIVFDPSGAPLAGSVIDNSTGGFDYGWLGQHQRPLEHEPGLTPIIEMGARQYSPSLGRFLEVDPIEGGTTINDYGYVRDPIDEYDLSGEGGWHCDASSRMSCREQIRRARHPRRQRSRCPSGWQARVERGGRFVGCGRARGSTFRHLTVSGCLVVCVYIGTKGAGAYCWGLKGGSVVASRDPDRRSIVACYSVCVGTDGSIGAGSPGASYNDFTIFSFRW